MESRIATIETLFVEMEQKIKMLENKMSKQEKVIKKLKKQLTPETEKKPKKPSGFAKPIYISPELCEFLNLEKGTEIPRTEVTKLVLQYVKDNNLQNKEFKKNIDFDEKLTNLLKPAEGEIVTYFTIQKLLKLHYVKPECESEKTEPVPTPAPATPATPATPDVTTKEKKRAPKKK